MSKHTSPPFNGTGTLDPNIYLHIIQYYRLTSPPALFIKPLPPGEPGGKYIKGSSLKFYSQFSLAFDIVQLVPPSHMLAVPGGTISFTCLPLHVNYEISRIDWMMNDTLLEDLDAQGIEIRFSDIGNGLGTLRINQVPSRFNRTTVRCRVTFSIGKTVTSNPASIMILQGRHAIAWS